MGMAGSPEALIPVFKLDRVLNQGMKLTNASTFFETDELRRPEWKTRHHAWENR